MFGKSGNNFPGNSVNVNTKLYTSYSEESLLTVSGWNDKLSIKLSPAKGKNEDGLTVYSSESVETVVATVTPEIDQLLLAGINDEIIPAVKSGKASSIAVVTGSSDKRKVVNIVTDGKKVVLNIVFGGTINLDGTSSGTSNIVHTFNDRKYFTNYSKDEGGNSVELPSDFYAFVDKLKELEYVDGSISHGIAYNNAVKASFTTNKSSYQNNQQVSQNTYAAPVTNIGDTSVDELLPFE